LRGLRQKFPAIKGTASDDICYATQNRQEAVEQVAKDVDFILVVGSPNSSNSNRLVEVAKRSGVKAQLIDSAKDIDPAWLVGVQRVGLTAGASAPEVLVEQVSNRLAEIGFTDQRGSRFDSRGRAFHAATGTGERSLPRRDGKEYSVSAFAFALLSLQSPLQHRG